MWRYRKAVRRFAAKLVESCGKPKILWGGGRGNITILGFLLPHYGRFEGIGLFSLIHEVLLNSFVMIMVHGGWCLLLRRPLCAHCVILAHSCCGEWFPPLNLSPPAWRLTPWSSFSQRSLSQALRNHSTREVWWLSWSLTTWAIHCWHYPSTLVTTVNYFDMFIEAMSKNISYFSQSIATSHQCMIRIISERGSVTDPVENAGACIFQWELLPLKALSFPKPLCNENITGF